jgi:AmmeMemoRadiSam system protein B
MLANAMVSVRRPAVAGTFYPREVSSDLSHYVPYDEARRADEETGRRIEQLVPVPDRAACGAAPLNGLLFEAARRGMSCERLDLRNSGDTAGDRGRVVGYSAFALREGA